MTNEEFMCLMGALKSRYVRDIEQGKERARTATDLFERIEKMGLGGYLDRMPRDLEALSDSMARGALVELHKDSRAVLYAFVGADMSEEDTGRLDALRRQRV
jgi:hypothetical protein